MKSMSLVLGLAVLSASAFAKVNQSLEEAFVPVKFLSNFAQVKSFRPLNH